MTTLIEIENEFNNIEDRVLAELGKAKERAKLLGELPHTVSLNAYFNNQVLGSDSRQMTIEDGPESDTPYIDHELISTINQVIDTRLAKRLHYFQPDHEELITWGILGDLINQSEQHIRHYIDLVNSAAVNTNNELRIAQGVIKSWETRLTILACIVGLLAGLIAWRVIT